MRLGRHSQVPFAEVFNPACQACQKSWLSRVPAFGGGTNWPLLGGSNVVTDLGTVAASSQGTSLTANSVANTKGTTYTQLIASTAENYAGLLVHVTGNQATASVAFLIDIAVGAAAAEQVLIPNVYYYQGSSSSVVRHDVMAYFPVAVAAGSRLSMRSQSSVASGVCIVQVLGVPINPFVPEGFTRCTSYGEVLASSLGTQIDSGAVANTEGAYAALSASTTNPMKAIRVIVTVGNGTLPATAGTGLLDLAIGAAAAEQVVIPNLQYIRSTTTGSDARIWSPPVWPVDIPSATRLAARCQFGNTDANARLMRLVAYGFD